MTVLPPGRMRLHVLQHVPFEGPARIGEWARSRGHQLSVTHLYAGDEPPAPDGFDFLVVMGGPMSVHDEAEHPWLVAEKRFVARVIEREQPLLGVCLGAQLIAAASGARVYVGAEKEIGWYPVQRVEVPPGAPAHDLLPAELIPFHWHGETFDLPRGAVRLAETPPCPNQGFWLGERVLGLQFHIEATVDSVQALVDHASDDITQGRYQQSPAEILAQAPPLASANAPILDRVLDRLSRL